MKTFFSLLKRELKQNLGFGILTFVYIIFVRLIPYISTMTNAIKYYNSYPIDSNYAYLVNCAEDYMGSSNSYHFAAVIIPAILLAILFCSYLHSRKTVDFYNSLPVKKTTVFGAKYLCGIIVFILSYALNYILMLIASLSMGALFAKSAYFGFMALIQGIFGFAFIYSVCTLAGLLTATIITHIIMGGILNSILPLVLIIIEGSMSQFYMTYSADNVINYTNYSPITYFTNTAYAKTIKGIVILAVCAIISSLICFAVCKIRPSEATERALAFKKIASPLRIIFSVICGFVGGFIAVSMFNADGILMFAAGLFIVTIISSIIIEIIFRFDFTAALKKKFCIVIPVVIDAVFIAVILATVKPYNTYVPSADKIASAAIAISEFGTDEVYKYESDEAVDYIDTKYYNGEKLYEWSWYRESLFENMNITDGALVNKVLNVLTDDYKDVTFTLPDAPNDEERLYSNSSIEVKCTLTNGKTYYRRYSMRLYDLEGYNQEYSAEEKINTLRELFDSEEYQKGFYNNAFSLDPADIKVACLNNGANYHQNQILGLTDDQSEKLISALQADLLTTTYDELVTTTPYAGLDLITKSGDYQRYESYYIAASIYIYPSYSETLSVLEEIGFKLYSEEEILNNISAITVTSYSEDYSSEISETYSDPNQIKQIYPSLLVSLNRFLTVPKENCSISVKTFDSPDDNSFIPILKKPAPEFITNDLSLNDGNDGIIYYDTAEAVG